MRRPEHPILIPIALLIGLSLVGPTAIVIAQSFSDTTTLVFPPRGFSFRHYENLFSNLKYLDGFKTSIKVAVAATALATAAGTLAALALDRGRMMGKRVMLAGLLTPMIVPWVIAAIGMFFVQTQWGIRGSTIGLVMAHATLGVPFVVLLVSASLETFDRDLERAAESLGAGPFRTFFRVTMPNISGGIVAGAMFAFIISWDEIILAIFLTSPTMKTLPMVMWEVVQQGVDPTVAAVTAVVTAGVTIPMTFAYARLVARDAKR